MAESLIFSAFFATDFFLDLIRYLTKATEDPEEKYPKKEQYIRFFIKTLRAEITNYISKSSNLQ